jgi:hypothetical protein
MQPFSITLFATTSNPEGIQHFDKSKRPDHSEHLPPKSTKIVFFLSRIT